MNSQITTVAGLCGHGPRNELVMHVSMKPSIVKNIGFYEFIVHSITHSRDSMNINVRRWGLVWFRLVSPLQVYL